MFLDPIFRFNWIFYMIYTRELQHSAILSFLVGFSEISRRGVWTLFRVENEHCTNVGRFRASRDVPLPYDIPFVSTSTLDTPDPGTDANAAEHADSKKRKQHTPATGPNGSASDQQPTSRSHASSGADLERATTANTTSSNLRQRRGPQQDATPVIPRGIARVGTMMAEAHAQDFERKRRPGVTGGEIDDGKDGGEDGGEVSSDEEYGEEIEEDHEHAQDVSHVVGLLERHRSGTAGEEGGDFS